MQCLEPCRRHLKLAGLWSWAVTIDTKAPWLKTAVPTPARVWDAWKSHGFQNSKGYCGKSNWRFIAVSIICPDSRGYEWEHTWTRESHVKECQLQSKRSFRWPSGDKPHFTQAGNALVTSHPAIYTMPVYVRASNNHWSQKWSLESGGKDISGKTTHIPTARRCKGVFYLMGKDLLVKSSFCFVSLES